MSAYLDTVKDEYGRPVEGATVYVYNADGSLASLTDGVSSIPNPVVTDETGLLSFTVPDNVYRLDIHFAGRLQYKGSIVVGATGDAATAAAEASASAASATSAASSAATDAATASTAATNAAASAAAAADSAEQASQAATGIASTDLLPEGSTNKYYTDARVRAATLTGLSTATGTAPTAADSVLSALGKIIKGFFTDHVGSGGSAHADVVAGGASGFMSGAQATKLAGIATAATANDTDANLKNRANHTGTQASSTITQATSRFLGRLSAGSGATEELTAAQLRAALGPNVQTVSSSSTVTPAATDDMVSITSQAAALTLANPSGSPVDGWGIVVRIKDNGTARAISFGTQYRAVGVTLPTTTVATKTLYLGLIYNSSASKWDVVSVIREA